MNKQEPLHYEEAYLLLYRRVRDALGQLDAMNLGAARELLLRGQREAEELAVAEAALAAETH